MFKKDLNSFRKDLEAITSTIGKTKYDRAAISNFFIIYGAVMLLVSTAGYIMDRSSVFWQSTYTVILNSILYPATVFLVIYFFIARRRLRQENSVNTLKIFDVWGFEMLFLPILLVISGSIAEFTYSGEVFNSYLGFILIFVLTVLIVTFIATLYFTGVITEDKNVFFIAVVFSFIFVVCYFVVLRSNADETMEVILTDIYYYLICFIPFYWASYILLGVYFKLSGRMKNEDD